MYCEIYTRYFQFFRVPDEHFFHCPIGNRLETMKAMGKAFVGSSMYVNLDPERARFGNDALTADEIRNAYSRSGKLFARKFDPDRALEIAAAIEGGRYFEELVGYTPAIPHKPETR
jgi:hypothetical protein